MKVKDDIKKLRSDGWVQVWQEGSHRSFKKVGEPDVITVSGSDSQDVSAGQLSDIRIKSGLTLR